MFKPNVTVSCTTTRRL